MLRLWTLVVLLVFAGCTGPSSDPQDQEAQGPRVVVSDSGSGRLTVTVVDAAIRPLADAVVTLRKAEQGAGLGDAFEGTTGADGSIVFEGIDPGTYGVNASAPGFVPARSLIEVVDGDAYVRVLLEPDASYVAPQIETLHFSGFIEGTEVSLYASRNTDTFYNDCTCIFSRRAEPALEGFVVDVVWDDSVDKPVGEPRQFRWLMSTSETFDWEIRKGASPWTEHVDPEIFEAVNTTEHWEMAFYPEEDWVRFQQPFDVYWTAFIAQPVPEGWSFLDQA